MAKKKEVVNPASDVIFSPDEPVFVIGGGASLKDFDWSRLDGKQVLAVNTAYRKLANATAMFFGTQRFYDQWKDRDAAGDFWRFHGRIFTSLPGFSMHPRIETVAGLPEANSGVQAVALAQQLGAGRIVLLGFDGTGGHWHDGTSAAHAFTPFPLDTAQFSLLSGDIVNCSPESAITDFPIEPITNFLKE